MVKIEKQIRNGLPLVGYPPYGQIHAHSTGNRNSTAQNEADYMNRKDINSGFYTHVVGNSRVIQVADTNRGAWDVGGGWNQWGYASVELIESHKTKEEFLRDYKIYVDLLRSLADEAGIPKKLDSGNIGINTHEYCTYNQPGNASDHVDPYPYLQKWGITRQQFKKDIENGFIKQVVKQKSDIVKGQSKPGGGLWLSAHISNKGWLGFVGSEVVCGSTGYNLPLEAVDVRWNGSHDYIESSFRGLDGKWTEVKKGITGTTGKAKAIDLVCFKENDEIKKSGRTLQYRVHSQDVGWSEWKSDGRGCGAKGKKIEAIQMRMLKNGKVEKG